MSNTDPTKHLGVNPGDRRRISSSWKLSLQDICQRFEQRIITLRYQMGNRKSKKGKQKDKPKSTKHYTENEKSSITNPTKIRGKRGHYYTIYTHQSPLMIHPRPIYYQFTPDVDTLIKVTIKLFSIRFSNFYSESFTFPFHNTLFHILHIILHFPTHHLLKCRYQKTMSASEHMYVLQGYKICISSHDFVLNFGTIRRK